MGSFGFSADSGSLFLAFSHAGKQAAIERHRFPDRSHK